MNTISKRDRRGGILSVGIATLIGLVGSVGAAPRFVMEIRDGDGNLSIAGESDAPGHEGGIEVVSFGKSYRPSDGFPALDTTGIECGIVADKSLPKLLVAACATGSSIGRVDIFYLGDDSQAASGEAAHMRLEHVQVSGVNVVIGEPNPLGFSQNGVAMLSLNFSKVTWTHQSLASDGSVEEESSSEHVAFLATEDPNFDDDDDGLDNLVDPDDDNDGTPDGYELAHGLDALVDDSDGDLDHDRQSNHDEWVAGTRANDGSSFFAIESLTVEDGPEGRTAAVTFPVRDGRRYRLLGTANPTLPREGWIEFDAFEVPEGSPETGMTVNLVPGVLPQLDKIFFTVEVNLPTP